MQGEDGKHILGRGNSKYKGFGKEHLIKLKKERKRIVR